MATKKQNQAEVKRKVRAREKCSEAKRDVMLGRAARRRWGSGVAK